MKITTNFYSNQSCPEFIPLRYDFLFQLSGMDSQTFESFFRFAFYYWNKNCDGIKPDDEILQRIAQCPTESWNGVRETIFDNQFFFLMDENGLWQFPQLKVECEKICQASKRRMAATASARLARLSKFNSKKSTAAIKVAKSQKKEGYEA